MRRARTRDVLEAVGQQRTPAPDPAFVHALGERLAGGPGVAPPVPELRRRVVPPAATLAVAAAAVLAVVVGLHARVNTDRVVTEPGPTAPSSTVVGPTTSTIVVAPPVTTPGPTSTTVTTLPSIPPTTTTDPASSRTTPATVVAHEPATTEPPPSTTTTTPSTTTSTTSPTTVPDLHEVCTSTASPAVITCRWDASSNPKFSRFRVVRRTADGPETLVYEGTATTASEPGRTGARVYYLVTALAADGTVLARGQTGLTCC